MSNKSINLIIGVFLLFFVIAMAGFFFIQISEPEKITASVANTAKLAETPQREYAQIMFLGDLMFDRGIRYYAGKNGGNNFIFEKISDTLVQNDLNVVNLEGPITDNTSVSAGTMPGAGNNYYFTFDPSVAETLFYQNIKLASLGNNHILNFGKEGLSSTKKYLSRAGVDYFGAPDYPRSITKEINGLRITFINYNEFASSGDTEKNATIEEIQKAISRQIKGETDVIIVFCHWGVEYEKTPRARDIDLARQFVDAGADLVVGSHPHVVQATETYKGKKIYYSLGNFIFDQYFDEDVRNGLGVIVKIDKQTKQMDFSECRLYLQTGGQTIIKN